MALTGYGLVRAALQAVRYYTAYRRLDMPAMAKLASDCYLMPGNKAVADELAAGERHEGQGASGTSKSLKTHKHEHHSFLQLFAALGIRRLKRWTKRRRRRRKQLKERKRQLPAGPVSLQEAFKTYRAGNKRA